MAGNRIKGITIEIGGDTTGLQNALKNVNGKISSTQSALKDVNRLLKLDPTNTELLAQKQELLKDAVSETSKKLDTLKEAQTQVEREMKSGGKVSREQYEALKREVIETEIKLESLKEQAESTNNSFKSTLKNLNEKLSSTKTSLRDVNSLLKLDPTNTEQLAKKQQLLSQAVNETLQKLKALKDAQTKATKEFKTGGGESRKQYAELTKEIAITEKELEVLKQQAEDTNSSFEKISETAGKISEKADAIGKKLSVITGAVSAAGVAGVNTSDDIKTAMNDFKAATDYWGEGVGEKWQAVMENIYKNNYGESFQDISDAMQTVSQQLGAMDVLDGTGEEMQDTVESAFALRDTFGYDIPETVRSAKTMMKQFGISAKQAFGLIAQGAQQGLDFSGELTDSINEYSVHFEKLGLTADDMFNVFASGTKNGAFNLDKIGDAIKEFSIRAIDGSETTAAGFEMIGMDADKMAKKIAAGGDEAKSAFEDIIKGLADIEDPVQQSAAGVNLFGTMWEDLGPSVITSLSLVDEGINSTYDSMQDIKNLRYDDLKTELASIGRTIQTDILAPLGEELIPIIEELVDKIKECIKAFSDMSPEQKEMIAGIIGIVAVIGPLLIIFGKLAGGISSIMDLMSKLSPLFGAFTGAAGGGTAATSGIGAALIALTGPVGLVVAGIAAIIAIFAALYINCEDFRNFINDGLKEIFGCVTEVIDLVKQKFADIGATIKSFNDENRDEIEVFVEVIKLIFALGFTGISTIVKNAISGIKFTIDVVLLGIKNNIEMYMGIFESIIDGGMKIIQGIIDFITGVFTGDWEKAWDGLVGIVDGMWDAISGTIASVLENIGNQFKDIVPAAIEWGKDMIMGFVDGIKKAAGAVKDAVKDIGNKIASFLHFSRPDEGPLRNYETWMPDFVGRMAEQIRENKHLITEAVSDLAVGMNIMADGTPASSNTQINFNGNYNFNNRGDIDYFMNQAALRMAGDR